MDSPFNPDTKKEVVGGLGRTLLFIGGTLLEFIGLVITVIGKSSKIPSLSFWIGGDFIWLIGTIMIVSVIISNIKNKVGGGFRAANVVMKIIVIVLTAVLMALVNFAS